ncbi:hypothetical protein [Dyella tabacisoli]|uniref:Uncharacterized protein n=1 Tax=Dyella tabacisoli TaxID=2282381 RepID=A0A369UNH2_9GAMM|nr:hypothetical protein [Dyella tabacisoli]RDD82027.1 hypothetical protein DVJ77_09605 [Dyella tabacisoli]
MYTIEQIYKHHLHRLKVGMQFTHTDSEHTHRMNYVHYLAHKQDGAEVFRQKFLALKASFDSEFGIAQWMTFSQSQRGAYLHELNTEIEALLNEHDHPHGGGRLNIFVQKRLTHEIWATQWFKSWLQHLIWDGQWSNDVLDAIDPG